MALSTAPGAEVQRPLATVVIGGLMVGMVVSMLSLPAMLLLVVRNEKPKVEGEEEVDDFDDHDDDPAHGHH